MYRQLYAEIACESGRQARAKEREALEAAIAKLTAAKASGAGTPQAFEATDFLKRLWAILLADLRSDENGLPVDLRASLISIGLWVCREADLVDAGRSDNFEGLIDVNRLICDGLV